MQSLFSQEQQEKTDTRKVTCDVYWGATLSGIVRDFIPTTETRDFPPYIKLEITYKPVVLLRNFGFTVQVKTAKRFNYHIGLALLKAGWAEKATTIPYPGFSITDSIIIYQTSNVTTYINRLAIPAGITFLQSKKGKWTRAISTSVAICYTLNYHIKNRDIAFDNTKYIRKSSLDFQHSFRENLGISFEAGYRFDRILTHNTYFWVEPYIQYLFPGTAIHLSEGYANTGIYFGIQVK